MTNYFGRELCLVCGKPKSIDKDLITFTGEDWPYCTCVTKKKWKRFPSYYGWECPICGMVYAPWVRQCDYCPRTSSGTTSTIVSW